MRSGSERRRLTETVQFRATEDEKERLVTLAGEHDCETIADYLRRVALGDESPLRRPRTLEVPMTAEERALVGRRAAVSGFDSVLSYARERLLDRDTEGMTVSRTIMELRRVTGLQKHLFNSDQLRSREYAELLLKVGDAIEAVTAAAARRAARSA